MDSYEGRATLEWWANPSTCLSSLPVRVAARSVGRNWACEATPEPPLTAEDRESFRFLRQCDPHFTLGLHHHASVLLVNVVETGAEGRLILTAAETDAAEPMV
ncbi:hypothetical protein ACWF9B_40035 [Streptomyces sp. NPDC055089]